MIKWLALQEHMENEMRKEMPLVEIVKSEEFRNKIDEIKSGLYNYGFILYPNSNGYILGDVSIIQGNKVNGKDLTLPYGSDLEELSMATERSSSGFPVGVIPTFKKDYSLILFYRQRERGMIKDYNIPTFIELMEHYDMALIDFNGELKRRDIEALEIFENGH